MGHVVLNFVHVIAKFYDLFLCFQECFEKVIPSVDYLGPLVDVPVADPVCLPHLDLYRPPHFPGVLVRVLEIRNDPSPGLKC